MTLTVADIERWDAGDVREVFHAASSRAQAVQDAANGIAELPAFATWGGDAAEAAKDAIAKTRCPLSPNALVRERIDFEVHRNGDIGSPLVTGSINDSNAATSPSSWDSARLRPPPARRDLPTPG